MAASTRSRVSGRTFSGLLTALLTVCRDTPAARATSWMVTRDPWDCCDIRVLLDRSASGGEPTDDGVNVQTGSERIEFERSNGYGRHCASRRRALSRPSTDRPAVTSAVAPRARGGGPRAGDLPVP